MQDDKLQILHFVQDDNLFVQDDKLFVQDDKLFGMTNCSGGKAVQDANLCYELPTRDTRILCCVWRCTPAKLS
jgi:hypothetical protein